MRSAIRPSLLLAGLAAAALANAQDASIDPSWPDWIKEALANESANIEPRKLDIDDGRYTLDLAGKPGKPEGIENAWYLPSDIGTTSPLECYLFEKEQDLATIAAIIAERNVEAITAANGELLTKTLFYVDAGAIGGAPYVAVEWLYTLGEASEPALAHTKVRAATNGSITQVCAHNELGQRQAFADAFKAFVASTRYEMDAPAPYYQEIYTVSANGQVVGVGWLDFTFDADGDTEIVVNEAALIALDTSTLSTTDTTALSYSDPNGFLINKYFVVVENGEVATNLSLEFGEDGSWNVEGTSHGQEVQFALDGNAEPITELGQILAVRQMFDGDEPQVGVDLWVPDIDPRVFQTVTLHRDAETAARRVRYAVGPTENVGDVDEQGVIHTGRTVIGPLTILSERAWTNGGPD